MTALEMNKSAKCHFCSKSDIHFCGKWVVLGALTENALHGTPVSDRLLIQILITTKLKRLSLSVI